MEFKAFLNYAMEHLKDGAREHFACSQVGIPIREGLDEDYWND